MIETPRLTVSQANLQIDRTAKHPRITLETIKAKIADVNYLVDHTLTICVITLDNGFRIVGKSAPAHPDNFDPEVGKTFAYEDAIKQVWPLMGFLLTESLHQERARG